MERIAALVQHLLIVIGLQEGGMTLPEMPDEMLAGSADVGEYAYDGGNPGGPLFPGADSLMADDKAMGVGSIMELGKRGHLQGADGHGCEGGEMMYEVSFQIEDDIYILSTGDSAHFDQRLRYTMVNEGPKTARVLWVGTPPLFDHRGTKHGR